MLSSEGVEPGVGREARPQPVHVEDGWHSSPASRPSGQEGPRPPRERAASTEGRDPEAAPLAGAGRPTVLAALWTVLSPFPCSGAGGWHVCAWKGRRACRAARDPGGAVAHWGLLPLLERPHPGLGLVTLESRLHGPSSVSERHVFLYFSEDLREQHP